MSQQATKYIAKKPDANGYISYTDVENQTWHTLYNRQMNIIKDRACDEYYHGVKVLGMCDDKIPQLKDVNLILNKATGWAVEPVAALISFEKFFSLLAERKFPAATFIRIPEELDYLPEPDIFHEFFGHCPMLTDKNFADFTYEVGLFGAKLNQQDRVMLARLYWFTVEFGLMNTKQGLRIYGGGILSSKAETIYALESDIPRRTMFDLIEVLRTPYRYDEFQKTYFYIDSFDELYKLVKKDLLVAFKEARKLGALPNLHDKKTEMDNETHPC